MQIPRLLAVYGTPLLVGAVFAACSIGVYPLMHAFSPSETGAIFVYSCFGVIGAAAGLLAICAVLGPGPFWLRMLMSFSVGLLLFCFWVIGFAVSLESSRRSYVDDEWRNYAIVLLCLPLVFLSIQSPLWLVRLLFRWDMALLSPSIDPPNLRPLTIRDMLTAMGLIGLGLAGARIPNIVVYSIRLEAAMTKILLKMTERDEAFVEAERARLEEMTPGVTITRHDAIRSLFVRASTSVDKVKTHNPHVNEAA